MTASKLQNLIHVFEVMTELQPILDSNFGEEYDDMLNDYADSLVDLCCTIMDLVVEGEVPNDPKVLNKVHGYIYYRTLPPEVLQKYKTALLNLTIQN